MNKKGLEVADTTPVPSCLCVSGLHHHCFSPLLSSVNCMGNKGRGEGNREKRGKGGNGGVSEVLNQVGDPGQAGATVLVES